jgi:hypothetical protein
VTANAASAPASARGDKPSFGRRLIDDLTTGTPVTVTFLAILFALLLGAVLIAFTDH